MEASAIGANYAGGQPLLNIRSGLASIGLDSVCRARNTLYLSLAVAALAVSSDSLVNSCQDRSMYWDCVVTSFENVESEIQRSAFNRLMLRVGL